MSEETVDALPLTSVEPRDAAVWREIDSEEPQPELMVRSDAPEMDAVTVLCKARGYIARQEEREWRS